MARHMMQQDMLRSGMDRAAVSNYVGNCSFYWGFFWHAYYGPQK